MIRKQNYTLKNIIHNAYFTNVGSDMFWRTENKRDMEDVGVASCLGKQESLCTSVHCLKPFTIANLLLAAERCGRQNQAI